MKFTFIYTFLLLSFAAFLLTSSSQGRAAAAGSGNTGAPGDASATCQTCHSTSATVGVSLEIDVLDGNNESIMNTGYTPEETYTVSVTITPTNGNPAAYGFQLISLNAAQGQNGDEINTWSNPSSNVKISLASLNGRTYAEHNGPSQDSTFTISWTAPSSGEVTFYSCGNGVNLSNSTAGDAADCRTLSISQNPSTSTKEALATSLLSVFPNPVNDVLKIELQALADQRHQLDIINASGQLLHSQAISKGSTTLFETIDVSNLPSGLYFLRLSNGQAATSHKFWKQ